MLHGGKDPDLTLVHGNFLTLHSGHFRLLKEALDLTPRLLIAINSKSRSDEEYSWIAQSLTGISPSRISCVKYDGDINSVIHEYKPAYLVKGSEFRDQDNPEEGPLSEYGGEIFFTSGQALLAPFKRSSYSESVIDKVLLSQTLNTFSLNHDDLIDKIQNFKTAKILVVGDVILDEYVDCQVRGLSREDFMPVAEPQMTYKFAGGAGIVARHCAQLGADTHLISLLGNDESGEFIRRELGTITNSNYVISNHRKTPRKIRYRRQNQVLFRLSELPSAIVEPSLETQLLDCVEGALSKCDVIILSDFSYGSLTHSMCTQIIRIAKKLGKFIVADSQSSSQIGDIGKFEGVNLLIPTEFEARLWLKDQNSGLATLGAAIRNLLNVESIIIKLGGDGLLVDYLSQLPRTFQVPAFASNVVDVSGAGDALLSTVALSIATKISLVEAAIIGSIAAAIQVSRQGNVAISPYELISQFQSEISPMQFVEPT